MKTYIKLIIPLLALALLSSCGVHTSKVMRTGSFMPDEVRLDLTMNDFETLGEGDVSLEFNRYFGFINNLKLINGKEVARRNQTIIDFSGRGNFNTFLSLNSRLRRASYEMHIKYPSADFLVPVNIITEKQGMFLGSRIIQTMKIKAYKIKDK